MAGRSIEGGMVYIGAGALAANGRGPEPSLIDPRLSVNWKGRDRTRASTLHNPSYRRADPRVRAAYLHWLAGGRRDKSASIGYVFLFFYGLERRLFADLGADLHHPEVEIILAEVERLRGIYLQESSFAKTAGQLLDFAEGVRAVNTDLPPVPWTSGRARLGVPAAVRVGIGKYVSKKSPIPVEWALSYLRHHPEGRLRTPAKRVVDEFDELFGIRYRARFGRGIRIPKPDGKIKLLYRAASSGFDGGVFVTLGRIPDITLEPTLIDELNRLARQCDEELDAYSRLMGRHPDRAGTPAAIGLLPHVLLAAHGESILNDLRAWTTEVLADQPRIVVLHDELVEQWSPNHPSKLTKTQASALAFTLANIGVGIEPDVRFGSPAPSPGTHAVLFPLPEGRRGEPTALYRAAMSLMYLSAIVADADGDINSIERRFVAERLEGITGLDTADRIRLQAHLALLGVRKPRLQDVKRKVKAMVPGDLRKSGTFLIDLAAADGAVNQEEIAVLEKLFERMGLDQAHLYSRAHTLDLGDAGPITIGEKRSATRWELPDPRSPVTLDPGKVRARLAETDRVSNLLADIFVDDDPPPETESSAPGPGPESIVETLDGPHRQLLDTLTARSEWDRGSVEELARSLGLPFLDSALDVINETAIDHCGEPVVEGDDPMVLNTYALGELI
ncbi:MAG: TerB N-terminal domain-containing protein [Acidimicrobiia bacterium]|nr:TerB N-terminal domain-containing protein [Acidimicrobiia bacterium]